MPQLGVNDRTIALGSFNHRAPRRHLLSRVQPRHAGIRSGLRRDNGSLADHQASAGTLTVVLLHQPGRNAVIRGAAAGQGWQDNPVSEELASDDDTVEQAASLFQGILLMGLRAFVR
jgi:hypothetical protein